MRASLRFKIMLAAGGLMLAPAPALAQSTAAPPTSAPPPASPDAVGPSELQNFSLKGSVTKPADQQPASSSGEPAPQATPAAGSEQPSAKRDARAAPPRQSKREAAAPSAAIHAPPEARAPARPFSSSPPQAAANPAPAPAPQPTFSTLSVAPAPATAPSLAPEHKPSMLLWVLAALFVAAGALFLLWRRRQQEAFAGGQAFARFVPPEPVPAPPPAPPPTRPAPAPRAAAPQPAPVPPRPEAPPTKGIVSSRLRPVLELSVQPLRCVIEQERVLIQFELELYNAGTAPARAVLAEARLLNAGASQEQELAAFFVNPAGNGERLELIAPMKRVAFSSEVAAPRSAIQEYELGGKKSFVPLLAFNALYQWSGGHAQSSAAFLVGRETKSDKLGPLSLERAPRAYLALAARLLPTAVRT